MNAKNMFGAITVAAALFFLWPAVFGSWAEVRALRDSVAERTQLVAARAAILEQFKTEYAKFSAVKGSDAGKNFSATVPVGRSAAELLSAVQDIAVNSGIQISTVQLSEALIPTDQAYKTVSLKLEMTGSYTALRTFLQGMENYVRILSVTKIQITTDTTGGQLRFSLAADAYFIK